MTALSVAAGVACGILSGFGIGGGSLLMVWMTAVMAMEQQNAQSINLLYFLPTAAAALFFHVKNRQILWRAVIPAAICGCIAAAGGAFLSAATGGTLMRKLFGGFLILVGISELFGKKKK